MSLAETLKRSFERMSALLFKPFSVQRWSNLILIGMLSGALWGGHAGFNIPSGSPTKTASPPQLAATGLSEPQRPSGAQVKQGIKKAASELKRAAVDAPVATKALYALALALILVTVYLALRLAASFQFVWIAAVVTGSPDLSQPYDRHEKQAKSFFWAQLWFQAAFLALLVAFGFWFFVSLHPLIGAATWPGLRAFLSMVAPPVLTGLAAILVWLTIYLAVLRFTAPIMAFERCGFREGFAHTIRVFSKHPKKIFFWYLHSIWISFAGGLFVLACSLILVIAVIIIAGLLAAISYVLFVTLLKAQTAFYVALFVLFPPAATALIAGILSANLPPSIFSTAFAIETLCGLGEKWDDKTLSLYTADEYGPPSRKWLKPFLVMTIASILLVAAAALIVLQWKEAWGT